MTQHVIGNGYKGVFLTVHGTVLINECKTVNIRIHHKCDITATLLHEVHDITQVLFKGFRVMLEITGRLTIEFVNALDAQSIKKFRKDNATY